MDGYVSEIEFLHQSDLIFAPNTALVTDQNKIFSVCKMFDGCIIYIHTFFIIYFVDIMRTSNNNFKYKIVTGFSDSLVPYIKEPNRDYTTSWLLDDKNLLCWFGVNKQIDHHKLKSIPIGIPRHLPTVSTGFYEMGEFMEWYQPLETYNYVWSTIKQLTSNMGGILNHMRTKKSSNNLLQIRYTLCNTDNPIIKEYTNFRRELTVYLQSKTSFVNQPLTDWSENIKDIQNYKYCLAPPGVGPDTFRTWESLLVGTVPIVFRTCVDELYEDLPILVIDSFEQINEEFLNEQYDIIVSRDNYKLEKLYSKYWLDIIRN